MIVIHVIRKPLSEGNVASNVLKWGTGALNIDGCRIGAPFLSQGDSNFDAWREGEGRSDRPTSHQKVQGVLQKGRWPANLLFSHLPGCTQTGTVKVKGSLIQKPCTSDVLRSGYGGDLRAHRPTRGHGDADGNETIDVWDCEDGCPVRGLSAFPSYDEGGPARYYKQFEG